MRSFLWLLAVACALGAVGCTPPPASAPLSLVVMTFNTGSSTGLPFQNNPDGGYGSAQAALTDQYYGNGLAWRPVVEDTRHFFQLTRPDLVGFQEIFHPGDCAAIPAPAQAGFVCETWQPGDPTVAQLLLGEGYQVVCHLGKPDKCVGVKKSFGTVRGCGSDLCLDGLDGAPVETCGRGSRIGRAVVELKAGGTLTLVNVHGSSGVAKDDAACRVKQFDQVFVDLGDGAPAASGERVVVLGDFNTDPARFAGFDDSANHLKQFAGPGKPFHYVTAVGNDAPATYAGLFNIDHVLSNVFTGHCWVPTVTPGWPAPTDSVFFDHLPHTCELSQR